MSDNKASDGKAKAETRQTPTELAGPSVDQTEKRRTLARNLINCATQMMNFMDQGSAYSNEYVTTGLVFVDSDFQGQPGLSHVNAQMMTDAGQNFISLRDYLKSNYIDTVFLAIKQ